MLLLCSVVLSCTIPYSNSAEKAVTLIALNGMGGAIDARNRCKSLFDVND